MQNRSQNHCRLCGARVEENQLRRDLCPVCDEYAQHVALQSNKGLEHIMGDLQNGPMFRAASRNGH